MRIDALPASCGQNETRQGLSNYLWNCDILTLRSAEVKCAAGLELIGLDEAEALLFDLDQKPREAGARRRENLSPLFGLSKRLSAAGALEFAHEAS
jgi:hypothetical protein